MNENESLRRQLDENENRLSSLRDLQQENSELRQLFSRASSTPYILAAVLSRPPATKYDELIIDIGDDYRLSTTSMVYASGGVPLGRVRQVLGSTSKVILFTSPGEKYSVFIGATNRTAEAVGKGGGQYEASLPHGSGVKEGDFVNV